ncbi:hypothetical protein GALMADRAFT_146653 [Galerina marginata CBS 339.88]|uniref:DUF6534 domain-containing protein n=1 Tax=Galerina marginata (strain CBS 339.88) TaxID=685588 RepID=A0A067SDU1_GALM3|nr:hypothetical protein GALMADRAFT_146653 [Galerina marginata CBS 339.88]
MVETDGNLGAVEIATFLSLVLLGVSLSQGYTYFRRSEQDKFSLKLMVTVLLVLEIFHSFTAAHTIYFDTITRWNRAEINSYSLSANVVNETLITVMVQCFFSHRIYRLSGKLPISIACFGLAILRFLSAMGMSLEAVLDVRRTPNWVIFISQFNWVITSALALGGATDLLIAASMLFYLKKLTSPSNMKSTTQLLNRLIRYSLQTGFLTSLTSLAVIVCFHTMKNLVWFGLYIILAKIYSNSLLASLNARPRTARSPRRRAFSTNIDFETVPPGISIPLHVTHPTNTSESQTDSDWPPTLPPKSSIGEIQVQIADDNNDSIRPVKLAPI